MKQEVTLTVQLLSQFRLILITEDDRVGRKMNVVLCSKLKFLYGWFIGWFGFNSPLRPYFSLYRAVSQREGERGKKALHGGNF